MRQLIIFIFLFASCSKEKATISETIFRNKTGHEIEVTIYEDDGAPDTVNSFSLSASDVKKALSIRGGGIGEGVTFGQLIGGDSIVVTFDGMYSIVHYRPSPVGSNPKNYPFESNRNIFNRNSYEQKLKTNRKLLREWDFIYTFTEQDYMDAK